MRPEPMPQVTDDTPRTRRKSEAAEPLRRRRAAPAGAPTSAFLRRPFQILLVFVTAVLVVDALVGDRGLIERLRARRQYREAAAALDRLRRENDALREEIRRLNEDPWAIEALARRDLGLLRPGELLFIVKNVQPKTGTARN